MRIHVFVDNSNVWIEGQYIAAVKKGYSLNVQEAHRLGISDNSWAIDFGRLLYVVTDGDVDQIETAMLFGSKPTDNDTLWDSARRCGFNVFNPPRNIANREKQVDTGVTAEISEVLYTVAHEGDIFILIMGDSDYIPIVEKIKKQKMRAVIAFWDNVSGELSKAADDFVSLTDKIDSITYIK